eukprot:GHRR01012439.1.p1 GENE.GHRR01012439.1~~GHRR01012439.1.p1  ORF type:complete len:563 (+),score=292.70 GHRR01012439.1:1015-2703(+)
MRQQQKQQQQPPDDVIPAVNGVHTATNWPREDYYDMRKREPLYAAAEVSCWWELLLLSRHAHPSVAAFARCLLAGSPVTYSGDPLRDLGMAAFLDKYVSKKPKATLKGTSVMQPSHNLIAAAAGSSSSAAAASAADVATLGSEAFAALAEADIPSDQIFFHKFFNLQYVKAKAQSAAAKAKSAKKAAAAAAGLDNVQGLGSDEEDEGVDGQLSGDLDDVKNMSDDELEDAAADKALEEAEGVGDDEFGDPDMGWDYDKLLEAVQGEYNDSKIDSATESDGGVDGTGSNDGSEGAESAEGCNDDMQKGTNGNNGSSGDGSSSGNEDGSSSDDGEGWVMLPEAAAGGGVGGGSKKKRNRNAGTPAGDSDVEGLNPFEVPSPSSNEGGDAEDQQQHASKREMWQHSTMQQQQQPKQQGLADADAVGSDSGDLDQGDVDAVVGLTESGDADYVINDIANGPRGSGKGRPLGKHLKQKRQKAGRALFADAAGYQSYFEDYKKALAAANGDAAAHGDASAVDVRGLIGSSKHRRKQGIEGSDADKQGSAGKRKQHQQQHHQKQHKKQR